MAAAPGYEWRAWADVKVGDVVRVRSRETFPADLLLLRGSEPPGQCWVNTKPLDGETDTKLRLAPKLCASLLEAPGASEPASLRRLLRDGVLRCEEPNDKVNDITAQLCLSGHPPQMLSEDNFLLRGCQLRNTDWVLALVTTTGVQTKINYTPGAERVGLPRPLSQRVRDALTDAVAGNGPKPKMGRLSRMVNKDIMGVVVWLIVMCVVGGLLYVILDDTYAPGAMWYLDRDADGAFFKFVKMTARYFLICYQFVPISLYVSMMFFQTLCRVFVASEIEMYDASQDEPCQVRQMSLLDELGQVSHIFSDKTGTLTSNHMEFRRASSSEPRARASPTAAVGRPSPLAQGPRRRRHPAVAAGIQAAVAADIAAVSASSAADAGDGFASVYPSTSGGAAGGASGGGALPAAGGAAAPAFAGCKEASRTYCNYEEAPGAPSLFAALARGDEDAKLCRELMLSMAVNHSVLLESVNGRLELSASSPDEQAFVAAAEFFGFDFVKRDADRGVITLLDKMTGVSHEVELLYAFPYESSRKRMSVIVKLPPGLVAQVGGACPVRLYTKGADSVLCDLTSGVLAPKSRGSDAADMQVMDRLLYEWADIALRTLVFAKSVMADFDEWRARYDAACAEPDNVRKAKLGEKNDISDLQAVAESGLTLQGATAIEDKLQDGVPEILADLRSAGVKVWMLTGDKVGTAKNIATACNILPSEGRVLELTCETFPVLAELKTSTLLAVARRSTSRSRRRARARPPPAAAAAVAAAGGGARRRVRGLV